jgi:hypothetical protein
MSLGSLISRTFKFGEVDLIDYTENALASNVDVLEAKVDAAVPIGVAAVIAAVEKADTIFGPAEAAVINATLNAYAPQLDALVVGVIAQAGSYVPAVTAALQALSSKLKLEALATV